MLISIIIPASNSEKTINRTIKSATAQNFKDFEIIIIENNSKDNTWLKLKTFENKFKNIRVFRNNKPGVSRARNLGIKKSKGKYVLFLDADDELKKNSLSNLFRFVNKNKLDFAISAYTNNIKKKYDTIKKSKLFNKKEISEYLKNYCYDQKQYTAFTHVWGRLYLKQIIVRNKIFFNNKFNQLEDVLFNLSILKYSKKIGYLNEILYKQNLQNIRERASYNFNHNIIYLINFVSKKILNFFIHFAGKDKKKYYLPIIQNFVVSKILTYVIRICSNTNLIIQKKKILKKIQKIFKLKFLNYQYLPKRNQDKLIFFTLKNYKLSSYLFLLKTTLDLF